MKIGPYQEHALRYDCWFDENRLAYEAELRAVRHLLPATGCGLGVEVGAGTGRFAGPLGIQVGVEPCAAMAALARQRGISIISGAAEALPFRNAAADLVLMVTVLCFVHEARQAVQEAARVLRPGGLMLIAMLDRSSPLGQVYAARKKESLFYRQATFHPADAVLDLLREAGLTEFRCCQTIFQDAAAVTAQELIQEGHGQGLFVVIRGRKP
ncbi:Methylase involved in ubiquinone/menaquinone biosynthesis [Candidatus Electronema halotolerans]